MARNSDNNNCNDNNDSNNIDNNVNIIITEHSKEMESYKNRVSPYRCNKCHESECKDKDEHNE